MNLCELLKGHEGETFYSPIYGDVKFNLITENGDIEITKPSMNAFFDVESNGKFCDEGEIMLFPSKDQRDWNKWAKSKTPKIWEEAVKAREISLDYLHIIDCLSQFDFPIIKSALALIKIQKLIEIYYGGNISFEEKIGYNNFYDIVIDENYNGSEWAFSVNREVVGNNLICFHTEEQAEEFLSYPENVQLLKDYYQI